MDELSVFKTKIMDQLLRKVMFILGKILN